jgi:ATP-dependent helicase/nuclease subunit A
VREHYFEQDAKLALREDLNLLYVAMTRAKQALLVSGSGERIAGAWYDRVANSLAESGENPLLTAQAVVAAAHAPHTPGAVDVRLTRILPTGMRKAVISDAQRRGIWLHGLLQHFAPSSDSPRPQAGEGLGEREAVQQLGIPAAQMPALRQQAEQLLSLPHLARFFDAGQYRTASNELAYVNARGETRRIDRLVEFDHEVWVLDYKTGAESDPAPYREQMQEYRTAMQAVYAGKNVRCALVFADGVLSEV